MEMQVLLQHIFGWPNKEYDYDIQWWSKYLKGTYINGRTGNWRSLGRRILRENWDPHDRDRQWLETEHHMHPILWKSQLQQIMPWQGRQWTSNRQYSRISNEGVYQDMEVREPFAQINRKGRMAETDYLLGYYYSQYLAAFTTFLAVFVVIQKKGKRSFYRLGCYNNEHSSRCQLTRLAHRWAGH
jgi:hypothetical protein